LPLISRAEKAERELPVTVVYPPTARRKGGIKRSPLPLSNHLEKGGGLLLPRRKTLKKLNVTLLANSDLRGKKEEKARSSSEPQSVEKKKGGSLLISAPGFVRKRKKEKKQPCLPDSKRNRERPATMVLKETNSAWAACKRGIKQREK